MALKKTLKIFLIFLIASFVLYSITWFIGASYIKNNAEQWLSKAKNKGVEVSFSSLEVSGYPFSFQIDLSPLKVAVKKKRNIAIDSQHTRLSWKLFSPNSLEIDFSGYNSIALDDQIIDLKSETSFVTVKLSYFKDLSKIQATLENSHILSSKGAFDVKHAHLNFHQTSSVLSSQKKSYDLLADIKEIKIIDLHPSHQKVAEVLGNDISKITFKADIIGKLFLKGDMKKNLRIWRDDKGFAKIHQLDFVTEKLGFKGKGEFGISPNNTPMTVIQGDIMGITSLLKQLARLKIISSKVEKSSRLVLSFLMKKDKETGKNILSSEVIIKDGYLFIGPLKVIKVPPLDL